MTIRKVNRGDKPRWVIDIPYRTADGRSLRYRRDAQVQTKAGAEAEHRRLVAELTKRGSLETPSHELSEVAPSKELALLDAELVEEELADSTRSNIHSVFRSVLRNAVRGGFLKSMPAMPPMPKVGRKKAKPMRRDDYEAILAAAAPSGQLAFELIAFGGLRPCEVRGLRWPDVDLQARTLTIRRAITDGEETTPKSHHAEVLPLSPRVGGASNARNWFERAPGRPWR